MLQKLETFYVKLNDFNTSKLLKQEKLSDFYEKITKQSLKHKHVPRP